MKTLAPPRLWLVIHALLACTVLGAPGSLTTPATQRKLINSFLELIDGPMQEYHFFVTYDSFSARAFDLSLTLAKTERPLIWANFDQIDEDITWTNFTEVDGEMFPPPEYRRGKCIAVLLVAFTPEWISEYEYYWDFSTTIIINTNPLYNVENLIKDSIIQRSRNILILEEHTNHRNETDVKLFSSDPFYKDESRPKQPLGNWDPSEFPTFSSLFPDRFANFRGQTIDISSDYDDYPLVVGTEEGGATGGMNIDLVNALANWLNFTYTTTWAADDKLWGDLANGTWNGLLGEIQHGTKNFTINYLTITLERLEYFDASIPFFWEGFGFALKTPPPFPSWQKLLYPFTWQVWISVAVALLLTPPAVYAFSHSPPRPVKTTFSQTYEVALMSLLRQNVPSPPLRWTERAVSLGWWWTCMLLTLSYTSNLIAVLTVPAFPAKLATIGQLAKSPFRTMMLDYGEFVHDALLASNDDNLRALGTRMDLYPLIDDPNGPSGYYRGMIKKLIEGKHAITETLSYLKTLVQESEATPGSYYFLKEQIYSGSLAFFFRKHTTWRYKFNTGMRRLIEAGLVNKWYKDLMGDDRAVAAESEVHSLTLNHLQGPFLVWLIGMGVAGVVFVAEGVVRWSTRLSTTNKLKY